MKKIFLFIVIGTCFYPTGFLPPVWAQPEGYWDYLIYDNPRGSEKERMLYEAVFALHQSIMALDAENAKLHSGLKALQEKHEAMKTKTGPLVPFVRQTKSSAILEKRQKLLNLEIERLRLERDGLVSRRDLEITKEQESLTKVLASLKDLNAVLKDKEDQLKKEVESLQQK
jgi:hypothetical protein